MPNIRSASRMALLAMMCWTSTCLASGEEDQRNYIQKWKDEAVRQMAIHRIPASITLAQGLLESGSGKSELSARSNNHFGIKCHKDWEGGRTYHDDDAKGECFRVYADARDSFEDHSLFLKRKRYESLFELKIDDYKGWARGLKKCGYATSPTYAKALIELIERHGLDDYDDEGISLLKAGTIPDRTGGDLAESRGDDSASERPANSLAASPVRVGDARTSGVTDNDVSWVQIRAGESLAQLAAKMDLAVWQLRKYNDLGEVNGNQRFDKDRRLYTQPKRRRGVQQWHTVQEGETLRSISDAEAVKLKVLVKRTGRGADDPLRAGMRIPLRFAPDADGKLPWYAWGGGDG
jgi:hypothetical protein